MIKILKILILFLLFTSCDKEKPKVEKDIYFGTGTALLNDVQWEGKMRSSYSYNSDEYVKIAFDFYEGLYRRNTFIVSKILFKTGLKQRISDTGSNCITVCSSFSTSIYDGDILANFYDLDEDDLCKDWIIIDSIDFKTLSFWGRYEASFVRDYRIPKMDNLADTLYFKNGMFNGKLIEK